MEWWCSSSLPVKSGSVGAIIRYKIGNDLIYCNSTEPWAVAEFRENLINEYLFVILKESRFRDSRKREKVNADTTCSFGKASFEGVLWTFGRIHEDAEMDLSPANHDVMPSARTAALGEVLAFCF